MKSATKYSPIEIEKKWYKYWLDNDLYTSKPDERESYTIVIPPPNVTGVLHMGHMLNNTIQDVLVRRARQKGKNACWVPGTDHASIATEAKVVKWIKEEHGLTKEEMGREKFLEYAWEWTEKYGGTIIKQLKVLGCSCDWSRTKFTLDDDMYESVIDVFIKLHAEGLIYKGDKMINWDPEAQTNISDEEVIYKEKNGQLFYLKYKFTDSDNHLTIATTRPETIFGDTAICVNPEDERYNKYIGKKVFVPIINREIPIIGDEYVDIEFGTGCLKITPAHDFNDNEIGLKHNLKSINIFNADASLNQEALQFEGMDRFEAKKAIKIELDKLGLLEKVENYKNKVGTSERTGAVVEPRITTQWFLQMSEMAKQGLDALESGELNLYPSKFGNTYKHWLNNIRDWNISRQLWWGHRIPVYYFGESSEDFVVAKSKEAAQSIIQEKFGKNVALENIKQEKDVLDTWFSAWLWPISVFDGIRNPNNEDYNYYYPTADLVTGPDIIFFWVARMVMSGYHFTEKSPFKNVFFTGIVRDGQRRKMSKQLGNSPDPIELMEKYGADGVRVGLLMATSAGNDLLFDEKLCLQGRNFANKIWNAYRLIDNWESEESEQDHTSLEAILCMQNRLNEVKVNIEDHYEKFRISDVMLEIYKLIWDDYCSWFLESIKPKNGEAINAKTLQACLEIFEELMVLLHPFMPFITEELWQSTSLEKENMSLVEVVVKPNEILNNETQKKYNLTRDLVSELRNWRAANQAKPRDAVQLYTNQSTKDFFFWGIVEKLANVETVNFDVETADPLSVIQVDVYSFGIPNDSVDAEVEIEKSTKEINYLKGFLLSVEKKLSNAKFVDNAPQKVIEIERKKASDAEEKIKILEEKIKGLSI